MFSEKFCLEERDQSSFIMQLISKVDRLQEQMDILVQAAVNPERTQGATHDQPIDSTPRKRPRQAEQ